MLPMLYHDVTFSVSLRTARCLFGSSNHSHPGLKHIRNLTLTPIVSGGDSLVLHGWIEQLQHALDPDTLQRLFSEFRIPGLSENNGSMTRCHRHLKTCVVKERLEKSVGDVGYRPRAWTPYASILNGKEEGMILFDHANPVHSPARVLVRCESGQVNALEAVFERADHGARDRMTCHILSDLEEVCKACVRTTEPGRTDVCRCKNNSALQTLTLRKANLAITGVALHRGWDRRSFTMMNAKVLAIENVTTLVLQDCTFCGEMIGALANHVAYLSLKRLILISSGEDPSDIPGIETDLHQLLLRTRGLQTIVISGAELLPAPKISALSRHCATLKQLYVDCGRTPTYSRISMCDLCIACPELEELALEFPDVNLHQMRRATPKPKALLEMQSFRQHISPLSQLAKLKTLRILSGPSIESDSRMNSVERSTDNLVATVLQGFHEAGQSSISVLSIGKADRIEAEDGSTHVSEPICYVVRNTKTKSWYEKSNSMTRVERELVKYDEPQCKLLEVQHESQYFLRFQDIERDGEPDELEANR